jgi:hypothetical protein
MLELLNYFLEHLFVEPFEEPSTQRSRPSSLTVLLGWIATIVVVCIAFLAYIAASALIADTNVVSTEDAFLLVLLGILLARYILKAKKMCFARFKWSRFISTWLILTVAILLTFVALSSLAFITPEHVMFYTGTAFAMVALKAQRVEFNSRVKEFINVKKRQPTRREKAAIWKGEWQPPSLRGDILRAVEHRQSESTHGRHRKAPS